MQRQIHFDNKFSTALFIFQFIEFDIRLRITNFIELNQNVPYEVNSNLEVKHNVTAILHVFWHTDFIQKDFIQKKYFIIKCCVR